MVLGYSRLIWTRFVLNQDLQTVLRCRIAALQRRSAARDPVRPDEDGRGLVIYNRALLDLARHYGFQPRACRPGAKLVRPRLRGPAIASSTALWTSMKPWGAALPREVRYERARRSPQTDWCHAGRHR